VINRASLTKNKALEGSKLLVVPSRKALVVSEKGRRMSCKNQEKKDRKLSLSYSLSIIKTS